MSDSQSRTADSQERYYPPGYSAHPLHVALIFTDLLGRIQPLALVPAWLALAAIACWPWGTLQSVSGILALAFTLADGTGLALLPRLGRSFGKVTPPLLALTLIHTALTLVAGLISATWPGLLLTTVLNLALSGVLVYATWIEPFHVGVTHAELHSPKLNGHTPLHLLHITDLHVERITAREQQVLGLVEKLDPDVIVLTGDYLNLTYVYDVTAQAEARDLLARLCEIARGPVYAITGSPPVDRADVVPAIFEGLPIVWLREAVEELHLNGHVVQIAGLGCSRERHLDAPRLRRLLAGSATHTFTLLLYHSPDLMPEAVEAGVDLYLCGHTHGGQIRLPLFGALITSSDFWKRYEMGRYEEGNTTLYVSRGLGMEGMGAPRARFLAPPEIVLWTLSAWVPRLRFEEPSQQAQALFDLPVYQPGRYAAPRDVVLNGQLDCRPIPLAGECKRPGAGNALGLHPEALIGDEFDDFSLATERGQWTELELPVVRGTHARP